MKCLPIRKYRTLRSLIRKVARSSSNLLLVKGDPGLGKTEVVKRVLRKQPHLLLRGKKSPLDLYVDLYEHRDMLVVIDDVDDLLTSRDGQGLIRDVTETVATKTVRWGTRSQKLEELGIPKQFDTKSKVILLTNAWSEGGVRDAIASRALAFEFVPPWSEVYRYAAKWFDDQVVLDFVHKNLPLLTKPDLRLLEHAQELRKYRLPEAGWQSCFDECLAGSERQRAVAMLLADNSFGSNAARIAEFERQGHGDRATFYRHMKRLKGQSAKPIQRVVIKSGATTPAEGVSSGMAPPKPRPGRPRKTPPAEDVVVHTLPGTEQGAALFKTSLKEVAKCL